MTVVDQRIQRVLNVRISESSRANLDAAVRKFKIGVSALVDLVLARVETIDAAVVDAWTPAPVTWRKGLTSTRKRDAEGRQSKIDKRPSKLPGDASKRGARRGHR